MSKFARLQNYRRWPFVAALLLLLAPTNAHAQSPVMTIHRGQHVVGDVATIRQDIEVAGDVTGDVTSWSGDITVTGDVGGDVVSYTGQVVIKDGGQVHGNVLAPGGGVERASDAMVAGQQIGDFNGSAALASVFDLFVPGDFIGSQRMGPGGRALFGLLLGILVAAFGLLWAAFWPRRTAVAALTLQSQLWRCVALGLVSTAVLAALLPLVIAVLAGTLIGLPLAVLILVVLQVPYLFGLATTIQWLGAGESALARIDARTVAVAVGLGLIIGLVAAFAPFIGLVLGYLLASAGLGAVLLSRGGMVLQPRAATSSAS